MVDHDVHHLDHGLQRAAETDLVHIEQDGLRASRTTTIGTQNFAWDPTGNVPLFLTDGAINYIYYDNALEWRHVRDRTGACGWARTAR